MYTSSIGDGSEAVTLGSRERHKHKKAYQLFIKGVIEKSAETVLQ